MAITSAVRISGGGIDSFLGFEYCDVIALASREFRVLLAVLPTSLRCLRIFGSSGSQVVATSPFFPTLMVYCREVPFLGF